MRTILRADLALTMDDELGTVTDPEIVIEDGTITTVRPRAGNGGADGTGGRDEDDAEVVDLPGRWLLPGFVNAHTHAAMALLRGYADDLPLERWLEDRIWPIEAHLDVDHVRAGTLLAASEMLAGGVTTFADMYIHLDGAAQAVEQVGIRAVLAPGLLEALGPMDETLAAAVDFVRAWDGAADGRISAILGPHGVYTCPDGFLRDIADTARELGVGVHMHLSETREEVERAKERTGATPVQIAADTGILDAGCLAAHCVWVDDTDIRLLADAGAAVAHNARSNMKLASGVAPVGQLRGASIPVALGTDGAASTNQLTMLEELRVANLLQKVSQGDARQLPARAVLRMSTVDGARAVGLGDQVGSLTPGKRADVVVLHPDRAGTSPVHDPYSTVVYSSQDQDVERVYCDGRLVAHEGRVTTVDVEVVRRDASRHASALVEAADS